MKVRINSCTFGELPVIDQCVALFHDGLVGQTYNIGGNNEWKNIDLVKLVCKIIDSIRDNEPGTSEKLITFVKDRAGHDLRYAINNSKIKNELGWEPSLTFEEAKPRLEELFELLPDDFLYPIEGRHESWFSDDAIAYLKQHKHCLVWNEVAGVNNPMPITSNYLYVRLIGDRSITDSEFGKVTKNKEGLIASWATKLQNIKDIPNAMVMVNNHFEGFGPHTANSLRMQLGMRELIWEEKKQKTLGSF